MFELTVIATGKLKEPHYLAACQEYQKRLGAYARVQVIELPEQRLPDQPTRAQILSALAKEAQAVRQKLPRGAFVCVLTPEGNPLSSEQLAERLALLKSGGGSSAVFVLGSSYGLDEDLKRQADLLLSMSPMTFPHHLARVMLLEQLYRAETIQAGGKYHK